MSYSPIAIEHAASRTLVIRSCIIGPYGNSGTGELFLEDVCGGPFVFRKQAVWARQLNAEQPATKIINDGGSLWILGYKTERGGTLIETTGGCDERGRRNGWCHHHPPSRPSSHGADLLERLMALRGRH